MTYEEEKIAEEGIHKNIIMFSVCFSFIISHYMMSLPLFNPMLTLINRAHTHNAGPWHSTR